MKKKIGLLMDKGIIQLAKRKSAEEGRPLCDLIGDALEQYLRKGATTPEERKKAFQLFCKRPMKISREQLRYLIDEDMWEG
jgi:hypothetical protein